MGGGKGRNDDADEDALYEEIGRLKMELDWLKKTSINALYASNTGNAANIPSSAEVASRCSSNSSSSGGVTVEGSFT